MPPGLLERADSPLAPLTTLGVGGRARRMISAYDEAALVALVRDADRRGEPLLLLGGGSNVLLPDAGVDTAVRVALHGLSVVQDGDGVLLTAAAGEDWEALVERCVAEGLTGVEALSGIPGSVGASPVQNIGAYGQEVAQTVAAVRVLDRCSGEVVELPGAHCAFGYRQSRFKREPGRWLVLAVTFALRLGELSAPVAYAELANSLDVAVGDAAPLSDVRAAVLALRRRKGMVLDPADPDSRSAGSFFTNPQLTTEQTQSLRDRVGPEPLPSWPEPDGRTKVSAAWLIERAGFAKGGFDGPAGISTKHTLALVNRGGARASDVLAVARTVRDGVRQVWGVELQPEPVIVGATL